MNLDSLKRFLKNKNTVTIIGVIGILAILYFGYSMRVNEAVNGVIIPVAKQQIEPKTLITDDMITTVSIPAVAVSENVFRNQSEIKGKYTNVNTIIPKGSMFYKGVLITKDELPDAALSGLKKGEVIYSFPVDMQSTYGNSILPGSKIDIFMKVGNGGDEKVMVGRLLDNIKVLTLKDSSGRAVFESSTEVRTPSMMLFGLPEDKWLLLSKASYLRSQGVVLFPVPQGQGTSISSGDEVQVSTQQLEDYINARAVDIPVSEVTQPTTDTLVPTFTVEQDGKNYKVTVTYPDGCGSTYVCAYSKDGGATKSVTKKTQVISYSKAGTLAAVVTEQDGTSHTLSTSIPTAESNSNTEQAG